MRDNELEFLELCKENIRQAVTFPMKNNLTVAIETEDYGWQASYGLSAWFAVLPERGTLKIVVPEGWFDYILQGITMRLNWKWLQRKIKTRELKYEAIDYLPNVDVPPPYNLGRFQIWWSK